VSSPNFPSNYLGLINEDESIEFTDGTLRLIGSQGRCHRRRHHRQPLPPSSSARPTKTTATPNSSTTSRSAIPREAIASALWRGLTSSSPWERRKPTRSWPSSSSWPPGRPRVPSSITTRGWSKLSMASRISSAFLADPLILDKHGARRCRCQSPRGRGPDRSPARHAQSPLQGRRERQDDLGQLGCRHWPQQQRHEQGRPSIGQGLRQGRQVHPALSTVSRP